MRQGAAARRDGSVRPGLPPTRSLASAVRVCALFQQAVSAGRLSISAEVEGGRLRRRPRAPKNPFSLGSACPRGTVIGQKLPLKPKESDHATYAMRD